MTPPSKDDRPRAIALEYEERSSSAPRVVAKGVGEVAQKIVATAQASGVPIQADADMVELLSGCPMGAEIPEELYSVVAELLTWLYGINGKLQG
jgi:flagellar biosynthesis protein